MSSLVGRQVGSFRVVEKLGQGGMGVVYKAIDTRLKRPVALKVLVEEVTRDSTRKQRFIQEAQSASALNHPNIVTVYEIGSDGAVDFIAMEYVEGEPLAAVVARGAVDVARGLHFALEIADGLCRAHERGIVHRDLKPKNLMITPGDEVKILDFGLAKLVEPIGDVGADGSTATLLQTELGTVVGTPCYMSPEQAEGRAVDARSDIFSFGTVLYEMFTGALPFHGQSVAAVLGSILRDQPKPLKTVRPDLPDALARIVEKALEKDVEYRYQHMHDVLADLKKLRRDSSVHETQPAPARTRPQRRSLWLAGSLGLAGAAIALLLWHPWTPQKEGPAQRLVSNFPGSHTAASFSPDGSYVAFQSEIGGVSQISIKNLAQGEPLQITEGNVPASRPRWSPNNDQIVFQRDGAIWSVPPPKGTPQKIVERGANPSWSWDGKRLVFERDDEIWFCDATGANVHRVDGIPVVGHFVVDRTPAFSPDGTRIAYFQSRSNSPLGDFWVVDLRTGKAQRVTQDAAPGGTPVWTSDGKDIIYSSTRGGSRTLWRVPVAGGAPAPVTVGAGEDTDPQISRDGQRLIYTNTRNSFVLKLFDSATGKDRDVMEFRDQKVVYPSFSPDGNRIAFFRIADEGDSHLFIIDRDGKNLTQVTRSRGEQNIFPHWAADAGSLYYFQVRPEVSFRNVAVTGGQTRSVVPGWAWGSVRFPRVDLSGQLVVYEKSEKGVGDLCVLRDLRTGQDRPLPVNLRAPRWSSDGKFILGGAAGEIHVYSVADGSVRKITKGTQPSWSGDGSHIYVQRGGKLTDGKELWRISLNGTGDTKICELRPMLSMDQFYDVSANDQIAWVQFKQGVHELWLMNLAR
jgi:serine/threonine protein kinase